MSSHQPATSQLILISPILSSQTEAWRRFIQEIANGRSAAYVTSRHALKIQQERIWIHETTGGASVMLIIDAEMPDAVLQGLATSKRPFDQWFREQIFALLGNDLTQSLHKLLPDLLFDWQSS